MKIQEILAWFALLALTVAAFCGTYLFNLSSYLYVALWLFWLVAGSLCIAATSMGKQVLAFAKTSKIEMDKVVWPTRQETIQTTLIVVVMVAVTGFALWGVDSGMMWIIGKITQLG